MTLASAKRIHFTGIKGVGMTALALSLKAAGKIISGSDTAEVFPTDKVLKKNGIRVKIGFNPKNIGREVNLVIYTGAHGGADNPEVVSAKAKKLTVLNYAQGLGDWAKTRRVLATAGVGGKSTTAAILSHLLEQASFRPSWVVGVGQIKPLGSPGGFNKKGTDMVIETDEYVADPKYDLTPKFHYLKQFVAIITNLELDHPDVYPDLDSVFVSFKKFVNDVPQTGMILINIDNKNCQQFVKNLDKPVVTYGFSPQADWRISKSHTAERKQFFTLSHKGMIIADFIVSLPGRYNLLNSTAAIVAAYHLGVDLPKLQQGLKGYLGSKRRFEFIGKVKGISLYDDYAHHPVEVKALLSAVKDWLPGSRIIAVFQSHTYSRTKALLPAFARCFEQASAVLVNQIFASARETDDLGISGEVLAKEISKHHPQVEYCSGKTATINYLLANAKKNDVIITVGAGNNWLWHKEMLAALKQK